MKAQLTLRKSRHALAVGLLAACFMTPAMADSQDVEIEPLILTSTPISANPFVPETDDRLFAPAEFTSWSETLRRHDARYAASVAGWNRQVGPASYSGSHYGPLTVEPVPVAQGDVPPLDQWYYPVD